MIGRKYEREQLTSFIEGKKSEFVVVFGRRRVGKTYLVRELKHILSVESAEKQHIVINFNALSPTILTFFLKKYLQEQKKTRIFAKN